MKMCSCSKENGRQRRIKVVKSLATILLDYENVSTTEGLARCVNKVSQRNKAEDNIQKFVDLHKMAC